MDIELYSLSKGLSVTANSSDTAAAQIWAHAGMVSERCLQQHNDMGDLINTAFVARDLMSVVDALEEDGLLRYWGLSYGTTLGATVSAMFPDRIGRIVLDGNQNVHEYYSGLAEIQQFSDAEKAFSKIWSSCIKAGGSLCPLALQYNNSEKLEQDVWKLADDLKHAPLALSAPDRVFVLNYDAMLALFMSSLYSSDLWPLLTTAVSLIMTRDESADDKDLLDVLDMIMATGYDPTLSEARLAMANLGIRGSDRKGRVSSLHKLSPTLSKLTGVSRLVGSSTWGLIMACTQWKFGAKERYEGPWKNIQTRNPILLIGNTLDGLTSIAAARNTSAIFEGSVVMELEACGHGSIGFASDCADKVTMKYFLEGKLPSKGKVCPTNTQPWELPPDAEL